MPRYTVELWYDRRDHHDTVALSLDHLRLRRKRYRLDADTPELAANAAKLKLIGYNRGTPTPGYGRVLDSAGETLIYSIGGSPYSIDGSWREPDDLYDFLKGDSRYPFR